MTPAVQVETLTEAGWLDITTRVKTVSITRPIKGKATYTLNAGVPVRSPIRITAEWDGKTYLLYEADT